VIAGAAVVPQEIRRLTVVGHEQVEIAVIVAGRHERLSSPRAAPAQHTRTSPISLKTAKAFPPHLSEGRLFRPAFVGASDVRVFLCQPPVELRLVCDRDRPGERRGRLLVTAGSRERLAKAHRVRGQVRFEIDDLVPQSRRFTVPRLLRSKNQR
jgi:hypothetical protein